MSKTKFIIRAEALKAMSLLAYQSGDRPSINGVHVEPSETEGALVLVASDGRKLGVTEEGFQVEAGAGAIPSFLIPLSLIDKIIPDETKIGTADVVVSFDGESVSLGIDGGELTTTYKLDPKFSRYPDWRKLIAGCPKEVNPRIGFYQGRYLAEFGRAAELLGHGDDFNVMTATGYGVISEQDSNPSELHIRFHGSPKFFGILRPVRIDADAIAEVPEWLAPKAEKQEAAK